MFMGKFGPTGINFGQDFFSPIRQFFWDKLYKVTIIF